MRVELFPFQKRALADIRMKTAEAMGSYHRTHAPQVVSFTAPTGAGKTIIMSALIEAVLFGDEQYMEQPDAIIVWLSDSPQLNEQSKQKIDSKADKIKLSQCVTAVSYTHLPTVMRTSYFELSGHSYMEPGICIISCSTIRMMRPSTGKHFCRFFKTGVKL